MSLHIGLVFVVIFILSIGCGCTGYDVVPIEVEERDVFVSPVVHVQAYDQLVKDVTDAPYFKWEYKANIFDCSNMAGVLVTHLDSLGYNAEIVVVRTRQSYLDAANIPGVGDYHTFVIVDRQAIVESTFKLVTFTEDKYGDHLTIDWYIEAYEIIGVYDSVEDTKRSKWGQLEFMDLR